MKFKYGTLESNIDRKKTEFHGEPLAYVYIYLCACVPEHMQTHKNTLARTHSLRARTLAQSRADERAGIR
jgi:hypothetical protein